MIRYRIKMGTGALCSFRFRSPPRRERKPSKRRGSRPGDGAGPVSEGDEECKRANIVYTER